MLTDRLTTTTNRQMVQQHRQTDRWTNNTDKQTDGPTTPTNKQTHKLKKKKPANRWAYTNIEKTDGQQFWQTDSWSQNKHRHIC